MTAKRSKPAATPVLEGVDASLLDIVDHVLTKGVVITGDVLLGVADVDLVYLRLSAVLCAADRLLGPEYGSAKRRRERAQERSLLATKIGARKQRKSR
jgi:hypothetical protein